MRNRVILGAGVLLALLIVQAYAATPSLINYQGRLTNAGGSPVADGSYLVAFTIYDAPGGGAVKWTETQSVTTSGGLFAVLLGSVFPISDTVFNSTTRYLGVKVGADAELIPRTRLVSVPYADRVHTVDGSTGGAVSGNLYLDTSTTLTGNIYKGGTLFLHNGGGFANTCLGIHSGNLTMLGTRNTSLGLESMRDNSAGELNTAVGAGALTINVSGNSNTAVGFGSQYLATGHQNTTIGAYSLYNVGAGSYNTAAGYGALNLNTADGNTAFGHNALLNNTDGLGNCSFGKDALYSNTSGDSNTACGYQALLYNTTGYQNTATGYHAMMHNTSGEKNTAYGYGALMNSGASWSNVAVGCGALLSGGVLCCAVGVGALGNQAGIGNTAVGTNAMSTIVTGDNNTAIGFNAQCTNNVSNATAIGYGANVDASNKVRIGNTSISKIEGQVAYTFTSDRNQKENFQPVDGDEILRKISGFNLTSWNYKNNDPAKFRHYGPMAQEFFEAFGHDSVGQIGDSVTINSGDEAGILFVAVQALEKRTAEIESLKSEVTELKSLVRALLAEKAVTAK